jgi:glycine cleavage system H protein
MPPENTLKREVYYTTSHEWVDFRNSEEAFIGITNFRIAGAKQIKKVEFVRVYGPKKKGDVLANIQLDNRSFQVLMPVDGSVISVNNMNPLAKQDLLLSQPETEGWLVKINISQPCTRAGLISFKQYNEYYSVE